MNVLQMLNLLQGWVWKWICEIFMCIKDTKSHTSTRKIVPSFHITLSKIFNTQPIFYKDPCQSTYYTCKILVFQPSFCEKNLTSSFCKKKIHFDTSLELSRISPLFNGLVTNDSKGSEDRLVLYAYQPNGVLINSSKTFR